MATTIQISEEMREQLNGFKLHPRETYNDVLERLLEDMRELDESTRKELAKRVREVEDGDYVTHDDVGRELGFQ